jgi:anti-sigma B factor antagonist
MQLITNQIDQVIVTYINAEALDASNAKDFKLQISPWIVADAKLIFDLSCLKFVDSSGLGALLSCLRQLNAVGGDLKLCGMVKPVRALFELVRMHRVFEIFNTQDEALRSYAELQIDAARLAG